MGLIVHRIVVKHLDGICPSDILYTWNEKSLDIMEETTIDIQNPPLDIREFIGGVGQKRVSWGFTDRFGLTISEISLKDSLFTIKTITHLIMTFLTWNLWLSQNIAECTVADQKLLKWQYKI